MPIAQKRRINVGIKPIINMFFTKKYKKACNDNPKSLVMIKNGVKSRFYKCSRGIDTRGRFSPFPRRLRAEKDMDLGVLE